MTDDPIPRLNAALARRYRIGSEIGEGGMATVYLADDVKHERKVALKVLKPELAAVVGADRFLAEIKTTANLQHPHILPLHDSGQADGFLYYVMPYVEGESLRDRLDREHQLAVDEAVQIAKNVAEALDYAHRKGVIHRDIKPANILLLDGKPVLSDFGIALAVGAAGGGRLTETGLSLGTPHYMSPEQATGDVHVGPATDVYALGCVLYEMLAGEPPYTGTTAQAVLGKIMTEPAGNVTRQRKTVPANVDGAIAKALEKLPADRFASAADFARALSDARFVHGAGTIGAAPPGFRARTAFALGALAGAAAVAVAWTLLRPTPAPSSAEMTIFPVGVDVNGVTSVRMPALFPDGSGIVFRGVDEETGVPMLFVRRWADLSPAAIAGTEDGWYPTVSPGGDRLVFSTVARGDVLQVVPIGGGVVRELADSVGSEAWWSPEGYLYYFHVERGILRRRADGGGDEELVAPLLPEDRFFDDFRVLPEVGIGVFTAGDQGGALRIDAVRLATGERKTLTPGSRPFVTSTGHLVYGTPDGGLAAARLDAEAMELMGPSATIVERVAGTGAGRPIYSMAPDGTLVYDAPVGASSTREFVWVTRDGEVAPVDPGESFEPARGDPSFRLSPDGTHVAFSRLVDGNDDIHVKRLPDGPMSRLTFDEARESAPTWSPDGESIVFRSTRGYPGKVGGAGDMHIWTRRIDGTGDARLLFGEFHTATALLSPDQGWLIVRRGATDNPGGRDILGLRWDVDTTAMPLIAREGVGEQGPALSRDGQWLAYASNETGRWEIWVRPFPDVDAGLWQVSETGGIQPVWAHNGRELFFVNPTTRELMAAEFTSTSRTGDQGLTFTVFAKTVVRGVLQIPPSVYVSSGNASFYDVAPGDDRFLMARQTDDGPGLIVIRNLLTELERLLPS